MRKKANQDLYLLGLGINGLRQMTLETKEALKNCRIILHIGEDHGALRLLHENVVDIASLYWRNEDRGLVYRRIKRRVIEEVRRKPGVAMVTYGHPFFFDDVNLGLWKYCKRNKLSCTVLPAVSCLDTLSIDLGIDYADGTQILEATTLVREERVLCPDLHVLILQIGEYDWDATSDGLVKKPGHFNSFIRYMRKFYPAEHIVQLVYSRDGDGGFVRHRIALKDLDRISHDVFPGMTLYVPPVFR